MNIKDFEQYKRMANQQKQRKVDINNLSKKDELAMGMEALIARISELMNFVALLMVNDRTFNRILTEKLGLSEEEVNAIYIEEMSKNEIAQDILSKQVSTKEKFQMAQEAGIGLDLLGALQLLITDMSMTFEDKIALAEEFKLTDIVSFLKEYEGVFRNPEKLVEQYISQEYRK